MHVITLICITDNKRWISNTALWPLMVQQCHLRTFSPVVLLQSPVQSSAEQYSYNVINPKIMKKSVQCVTCLLWCMRYYPTVCRHFVISLLFVMLSLETEFVHQGQIALNLFDVWSCTLSGIPHYLPLEYDIKSNVRFAIDLG